MLQGVADLVMILCAPAVSFVRPPKQGNSNNIDLWTNAIIRPQQSPAACDLESQG